MAKLSGRELRRQLIESLWAEGVPEDKLRAINIDDMKTWAGTDNINTKDPNDKFYAYLSRTLGVSPESMSRATKMAEWRKGDDKDYEKRIASYLKDVMGWDPNKIKIGYRAEQLAREEAKSPGGSLLPKGKKYAEGHVMQALKEVLSPAAFTQLAIKTGTSSYLGTPGAKGVPTWNPFRGDAPPGTQMPGAPAAPGAPVENRNVEAAKLLNKPAGAPGAPGATAKIPQKGTTQPAGSLPANPPAPKLPKTEAEVRAYIDENYSQFAYLQDIPEVWDVVKRVAKEGLSDDRALGELQKTGWWQKTEADARVFLERKYQDPATVKAEIKTKADELRKSATAAGITLPEAELQTMAEDSLRFKWTPAEEKSATGRFFKYDKEHLMGEALVTQQNLNQKARDWLVPMDDTTMQKWVTQVATGEVDAAYFDGYMREQAATLFPQLADPISRGVPPGQWMAPYASMAAQTLGINPDSIDLRESKWMKSINQVGPDGKRTAMNLSDWEDTLKTDEAYGWDKTDQGREHGATMARKLAGMFRGNA